MNAIPFLFCEEVCRISPIKTLGALLTLHSFWYHSAKTTIEKSVNIDFFVSQNQSEFRCLTKNATDSNVLLSIHALRNPRINKVKVNGESSVPEETTRKIEDFKGKLNSHCNVLIVTNFVSIEMKKWNMKLASTFKTIKISKTTITEAFFNWIESQKNLEYLLLTDILLDRPFEIKERLLAMLKERKQLKYLEGSMEGDLYLDSEFIKDLTSMWKKCPKCLGRTFVVKTYLGKKEQERLTREVYGNPIGNLHFRMHTQGMTFTRNFDSFAFEYQNSGTYKQIMEYLECYLD
ncbi:hypothetical protein QR680_014350 [Steinernema hermaphroditum]|uniref:Uncharacterized protein n=1 Tax=Steinernema hermaphroditum TaxID=289476 RepID=A0AA39I8K4_9BILA|nr:hypothetical protein QR680_014350 [Steinernema hermaphroditum]